MIQIDILRLTKNPLEPQFGIVMLHGLPRVLTLELPYKDNAHSSSCIPEGKYLCKRRKSSKVNFDDTYEVMGVPDRSDILFHWGNTVADTQGCILIGSSLGMVNFVPAILESRSAFGRFMALMKGEQEIGLSIRRVYEKAEGENVS